MVGPGYLGHFGFSKVLGVGGHTDLSRRAHQAVPQLWVPLLEGAWTRGAFQPQLHLNGPSLILCQRELHTVSICCSQASR